MESRKTEVGYIARVRTKAFGRETGSRGSISRIVFEKNLAEALEGIDQFSHLFVIFWMHQTPMEKRRILKVHPRGREDMPLVGSFATRTPHRPNPIGLTLVELLKVEDNVLTVRGLDAFDGTPVLDIKPFDPWDIAEDARVPVWWTRLGRERTKAYKSVNEKPQLDYETV